MAKQRNQTNLEIVELKNIMDLKQLKEGDIIKARLKGIELLLLLKIRGDGNIGKYFYCLGRVEQGIIEYMAHPSKIQVIDKKLIQDELSDDDYNFHPTSDNEVYTKFNKDLESCGL